MVAEVATNIRERLFRSLKQCDNNLPCPMPDIEAVAFGSAPSQAGVGEAIGSFELRRPATTCCCRAPCAVFTASSAPCLCKPPVERWMKLSASRSPLRQSTLSASQNTLDLHLGLTNAVVIKAAIDLATAVSVSFLV